MGLLGQSIGMCFRPLVHIAKLLSKKLVKIYRPTSHTEKHQRMFAFIMKIIIKKELLICWNYSIAKFIELVQKMREMYICFHVKGQSPSRALRLVYSPKGCGWQKQIQWQYSRFPSRDTETQRCKWALLKSQQTVELPQNPNFFIVSWYCHIFYHTF